MKKYFYIFIAFATLGMQLWAYAVDPLTQDELKTGLIPAGSSDVVTSTATWEWLLDAILEFIRDSLFSLLSLIAIGMFLFIWGRLLMARWNPEELSKALKSLVYAWVGLFVVAAAWAIVRFIAWIDIF